MTFHSIFNKLIQPIERIIFCGYKMACGAKNCLFATGKATRAALPYVLLIVYIIAGSSVFYLLQIYEPVAPPENFDFLFISSSCSDYSGHNKNGSASFSKAFYFMGTVYSSIGYGDVVPCTWLGKLLTLIFALTGVPLTIFCLGKLGRFLRRMADRAWRYLKHCKTDTVGAKSETPVLGEHLPLAVGIVMTFVWIFFSSAVFYFTIYEGAELSPSNWSYFDAIYFTVISLFTIGKIYDTGQVKVDNKTGKIKLTTQEQGVANLVLEMWKTDPGGAWLAPLMEKQKSSENSRQVAPAPVFGKQAQKLLADKWRAKASQKALEARKSRESSTSSTLSAFENNDLTVRVTCEIAVQTDPVNIIYEENSNAAVVSE